MILMGAKINAAHCKNVGVAVRTVPTIQTALWRLFIVRSALSPSTPRFCMPFPR